MLVTVSGLPGSGTTTVARLAADALGLRHVDGGTLFRSLARERGLELNRFAALAEQDRSIDEELDARLTDLALAGGVLLESRLAGWLASRAGADGTLVWIDCAEDERARRVSGREGHDFGGALADNRIREASERDRYLRYYGIDLTDRSVYDLVLDSTERAPDELVADILDRLR